MTYDNERDPRRSPNDPVRRSTPFGRNNMLPLIVAAAIAVALIAIMYPRTTTERVGDTTNTGPSVQTVTPAPSPDTAVVEPMPSPTTEPRPTQQPIQ